VRLNRNGEGLHRVKELVVSLRTFSRLDEGEFKPSMLGKASIRFALPEHKMNGASSGEAVRLRAQLSCYAGRASTRY